MRPKLVGIRDLPTSRQAYVTVYGKFYSQTFPIGTADSVLKEWRARKRAEVKYGVTAATGRTFAADATHYLTFCEAMPSAKERAYQIQSWADVFGRRVRSSITALEIRRQLDLWRTTGRYDGGPLTPASLNRRRTALMAMFTTLDGHAAPNVVKDVPVYDERGGQKVRAQPMLTVARFIRRVPRHSGTRARLRVMMWTGLPHALLKAVTPHDVDWDGHRLRVAARRKGKGMPATWIPLLPPAVRALRRVAALKAWGRFDNSGMRDSFARAQQLENAAREARNLPPLPQMRVYDIRHSFGTWAASKLRDDRALSEIMRTNSIRRYTDGAVQERLALAMQVLRRIPRDSGGSGPAKRNAKQRQKS